jgi:hypothetical protein
MPLKRKFIVQLEIEVETVGSRRPRFLDEVVKNDLRDLVSMEANPDLIPYEIEVLDIQIEAK